MITRTVVRPGSRVAGSHGGGPIPQPVMRVIMTIVVMLAGALTAYYTTVYGIRLTVSEKADRVSVADLDRRLVAIETVLRTDVASRDDLFRLETSMDRRLTRIEVLLEGKSSNP
ncbi:MAG TPA: hypothetical protein VGB22_06635 [candidate division Zixibacteria bacterium]|jgi:hypothetical protein